MSRYIEHYEFQFQGSKSKFDKFSKNEKIDARAKSKRDSNLLEKSRIRSISTSNILRGRPPLHAAKSKNHTTQSNPASKHARTQTPRVQCPPPLEISLNPSLLLLPNPSPSWLRYKPLQNRFTNSFHNGYEGGKKYFSREKRVYHGFLHLRPPLFTALNFRKQINPRIPVEP